VKAKLGGLRNIPTAMKHKLVSMPEQMRAQSKYDVLSELARLGKEKERLDKEKKNWQERIHWIDARLKEVENLEESLQHRIEQMAAEQEVALDVQDARLSGREMIIKY